MVTHTSLEAYDSVDLNARQGDVMRAIQALHAAGRRPCDQDIAARLGWTINRVTPRRGELETFGLVFCTCLKIGPTGRRVSVWAPTPEQMKLGLAWPKPRGDAA